MKALRRALVPSLAALLAASAGLVGAPASQGSDEPGVIRVSMVADGSGDGARGFLLIEADSTLKGFTDSEELVFSQWRDRPFVEITLTDAQDPSGQGRDILRYGNSFAMLNCDFAGSRAVCRFPATPTQIRVDFGGVTTDTTVVMEEGATVPLAFNGGSGSDYVQGGAGDDWIRGNGANDFLFGGPGDDYIDGGPGNDTIEGEGGSDDMRGGPGSDSIDAADNVADVRVDCGGVPKLLDFDKNLDKPTNCGANPTPIPPAPLEPADPPAPGTAGATVNGVQEAVRIAGTDRNQTMLELQAMMMEFGLPWEQQRPFFPPGPEFPVRIAWLLANTDVLVSIFPVSSTPTTPAGLRSGLRTKPIETVALRADGQGIAQGKVPVPAGQEPGNFVVQINAVTAASSQVTVNVGVVLSQATPTPDPGPTETIAITSAKRGKGKKAAVIAVTGTTTGLAGKSVTPRYRVKGAKKWVLGKPVTVTASGTFTWRHTSPQAITITMTSGAITSKPVTVPAARR
jgi:hypothetical protein